MSSKKEMLKKIAEIELHIQLIGETLDSMDYELMIIKKELDLT